MRSKILSNRKTGRAQSADVGIEDMICYYLECLLFFTDIDLMAMLCSKNGNINGFVRKFTRICKEVYTDL